MNTVIQGRGGHEACPQCRFPHMSRAHERCPSCGWARGTAVTPQLTGLPPVNWDLPGNAMVSIEQRIQAQQARLLGGQK